MVPFMNTVRQFTLTPKWKTSCVGLESMPPKIRSLLLPGFTIDSPKFIRIKMEMVVLLAR